MGVVSATDGAAPSSYDELIGVLDALPVLVRETRRRRRLSLRAAGEACGMGFASVQRCESGAGLHLETVVALLRWLGSPDPALLEEAAS